MIFCLLGEESLIYDYTLPGVVRVQSVSRGFQRKREFAPSLDKSLDKMIFYPVNSSQLHIFGCFSCLMVHATHNKVVGLIPGEIKHRITIKAMEQQKMSLHLLDSNLKRNEENTGCFVFFMLFVCEGEEKRLNLSRSTPLTKASPSRHSKFHLWCGNTVPPWIW